jgi:hypothetical protein
MDHNNMSLEDLIKKDRSLKGGFKGAQRGGMVRPGNFNNARGGRGGNQIVGNVVPRFKKQGGIFKQRRGGNFGGAPANIELPPRSGQRASG